MNRSFWLAMSAIVFIALASLFFLEDVRSIFFGAEAASAAISVAIFQLLLVADALLMLVIFFLARGQGSSSFAPLWRQNSRVPGEAVPHYALVMAVILLLATSLRFYNVNADIWMDEVFTLVDIVRQPLARIYSGYSGDNQHTLQSLLSHLSITVFGESALTLRLPAVLFGIASIWAVARLADLVFGQRVAVFAALLLTVSYHHIWFSQNARGYTMLLFAAVFSTEMMLKGLRSGEWRYWIGYAVAIAIGAWAHLTGVFIALAHGVVVLLLLFRHGDLGRGHWRPILALLLSGWLTVHCYGLALPDILHFYHSSATGGGWVVVWTSPLWLVQETLQRLGIGLAAGWAGLVVLVPAGIYCTYYLWRRDALFLSLGIAPGPLVGLVMLALGRNLWPRMFFNEAGFLIISVTVVSLALGDTVWNWLAARWQVKPRYHYVAVLPLVVLLVLSLISLPGLYRYPKQNYSAARDFVRQQVAVGDRVLGLHMAGRVYNLYYSPEWPVVNTAEELRIDADHKGETWLLYTLPGFVHSAMPDIARVLQSDYDFVKEFPGTLGDGEIIVLRSKPTIKESQ